MVALIQVTVTVRAEPASGETVQLKTFHAEKEQKNAKQKTLSDASDTQVVVDAAAVVAVCTVQWLCVLCSICPHDNPLVISDLLLSSDSLLGPIILFHSCPPNTFIECSFIVKFCMHEARSSFRIRCQAVL